MKQLSTTNFVASAPLLGLAILVCGATTAAAQTAPSLGDAENFAILANTAVVANLVDTVVFGKVGVSPGLVITGIPGSATLMPSYQAHADDAAAVAAQASAADLYVALQDMTGATALTGALGGLTLTPGIYSCPTAAGITAGLTLTLDGPGVYIFQIGSSLTTAALAEVELVNGATYDQVFWQCGTAASFSGRIFYGNVVAGTTVTVAAFSDVYGRMFAPHVGGTVTIAGSNVINGLGDPGVDPTLCEAEIFAVLAGTSVNATLPGSVVHGDVGVSPGTVLPGTQATIVAPYTSHANDAEAIAAQVYSKDLRNNLLGKSGAVVIGADLGGLTLNPGTYTCLTTAGIAAGGTLTLDGEGFYVFQIGTALTTAGLSNVVLLNGASANQIFWQTGTTASLSGDVFYGTITAGTTITMAANAVVYGRLFAPTAGGTITLAGGNTVFVPEPLDATLGCAYCSSPVNSTGEKTLLSASGSLEVALNTLTLSVTQIPNGQFGFFVASRIQGLYANPAGSQGNLCLGGNLARFNRLGEIGLTAGGAFSLLLPLYDFPEHPTFDVTVVPGDTWNFQFWHRDIVDGSSTSNFSNGLELSFY
jgi:hypothetical protein